MKPIFSTASSFVIPPNMKEVGRQNCKSFREGSIWWVNINQELVSINQSKSWNFIFHCFSNNCPIHPKNEKKYHLSQIDQECPTQVVVRNSYTGIYLFLSCLHLMTNRKKKFSFLKHIYIKHYFIPAVERNKLSLTPYFTPLKCVFKHFFFFC